jgi:hypothetical protein
VYAYDTGAGIFISPQKIPLNITILNCNFDQVFSNRGSLIFAKLDTFSQTIINI